MFLFLIVTDPDGDLVKCRYMEPDECHSKTAYRRACGVPTEGLTVNVSQRVA